MKYLSFLFLFFSFIVPCSPWDCLVSDIKKKQKEQLAHIEFADYVKDAYLQAYSRYKRKCLDFVDIDLRCDTLYFLECYNDGSDAHVMSTVWNRHNFWSYSGDYLTDSIVWEKNELYFSAYMMHLCSNWRLDKLEQEEKQNLVVPVCYNCLTRVVFTVNDVTIECFFFRDFFELKRDMECDFLYKCGKYSIW